MLNCFIIDDEQHAIDVLYDLIKEFPEFNVLGYETDPIAGLAQANLMLPAILFLDIEMPKLKGTELIELLHPAIKVVYTTGNPNFALQAFESSVIDYLLKPISYKRFHNFVTKLKTIQPYETDQKTTDDLFMFVKCDNKGKLVKIEFENINYVESDNNYALIVCKSVTYKVYLTLKEIEKSLPGKIFTRVHKRFIVNLEKIDCIDGNRIFLNDKTVLQLGVTFRESFLKVINQYMIEMTKTTKN